MNKNGLIEIGSILVDPAIFTTPFICDVARYKCQSACCYRACIITQGEAKRIEKHLPDIIKYLPRENVDFIKKKGSFVANCSEQPRCLGKCEIDKDEAMAIKRLFNDGEEFRCTWLFNGGCIFLYNSEGLRYCAIHSYALESGLTWEEFKMTDCVQYPLAIYINDEGSRVLGIQSTPYLADIPCKNRHDAPPMYKGLASSIKLLVGKELAEKITAYGNSTAKQG